jgi:hypothetical protein
VYHPYRQPDSPNHCLAANGRCSHLCVAAPQLTKRSAKTACLCPDGLKLANDNLTCQVDRKYNLIQTIHNHNYSMETKPFFSDVFLIIKTLDSFAHSIY